MKHYGKAGNMLKHTAPFVLLLCLTSLAQQSQNKTQPKNAEKQEVIDLTHPSPAASTEGRTLSKDYRKSAIAAVSSIDDWRKKALELSHSTRYSDGSVYASRSSTEREADAGEKAEKDVKTAKVDITTSADRFLQERLEIYLHTVKAVNYHFTHLGSEYPKKDADTMTTCEVLIEKALDEGTTADFYEHPEMSKCE